MDNPVHRRSRNSALAVIAMLVLTESVYLRPGLVAGTSSLMGSDYEMLHRWRLAFARQSIFGARHELPGWNPHEVLGAPFAANLQGFPWIPTRLLLLLLDPSVAYAAGVAIAAALAALFAYLYCRRAGLSEIGSAAAGWTFACAGFFSSRVMAGHLPLLEAYPALPLLLWLVDRALAPERERRRRLDLAALALYCAFVVSAGHPQIPAYALVSAFIYLFWRGRGTASAMRARTACAMVLGVGLAFAAWWPMLMLIGRSTRVLRLAAPDNDVAMPYSRLLALIVPGIQGWAEPVSLADQSPFTGFPNNSWFWDTASYVGLLPPIAIAALLTGCFVKRRWPGWRGKYLTSMGVGALFCSLPFAAPLLHLLPGTFLRSPARLLYISTFCAAVALGAGADAIRRAARTRRVALLNGALAILLALHFADLWHFAHWFIQTYPSAEDAPAFQAILDREVGSGRIAEEREDLVFSYGDLYDDAGGFDSIFLARFNRAWLALAGLPADTNEQVFDASTLPAKALEAMGVRFAITTQARDDLEPVAGADDAKLYRVANPAPRARFVAADRVEFAPAQRIPALFAAGAWDRLLLEPDARKYMPTTIGAPYIPPTPARATYFRPSSDEIDILTASGEPGFVCVLEAFDPGWTATVDGFDAAVLPANGFAMAIPLTPGSRVVHLRYSTPGRTTGVWLSLASLGLLIGLIATTRRHPNPWLTLPLSDYEGHMKSATDQQLDVLSDLFAEALTLCRPASVAVLGVAGGNGLDRIDTKITHRVVGIDINPVYLDTVRERYPQIGGLELHCADLAARNAVWDPVELAHAALVFEHAGTAGCLDSALALVAPGGSLSVVLQLPSDVEPGVGAGQFASIRKLHEGFALVDPEWLTATLKTRGLRMRFETRHPLASGKGFWMGLFERVA
jgi:hypothetical protein